VEALIRLIVCQAMPVKLSAAPANYLNNMQTEEEIEMLTKQEEQIKENLFNELMKQTGFKNLSMDAQGEMVDVFVKTVSQLRSVPITWEEEKTLHDCPACTGTGESQSGIGSCSACRGKGTIDNRPCDY